MGKQWKPWQTILGGSKITADGDCSGEIKRCLLLGSKVMTNLDSNIKKQRRYFANKAPSNQAMVFPVIMYWWESWTIKKDERQRIDAFELWCWRRLLRVPSTARISNQSILKKISLSVHWKDWCWSWNSKGLATWCKELTQWKRPWCWERLKAGGEGLRWFSGIPSLWTWVWVSSGSWWWTGKPGVLHSQKVRQDWVTELNWSPPLGLFLL